MLAFLSVGTWAQLRRCIVKYIGGAQAMSVQLVTVTYEVGPLGLIGSLQREIYRQHGARYCPEEA